MKIVSNVEDVIKLIANYNWLIDNCKRLTSIQDIDRVDFEGNNLVIYGSSTYRGCTSYEEDEVPIKWIFLNDEELKKAKEEKLDAEKTTKEMEDELNSFLKKQAEEQKDRAEYERLKKKYEG